MTPPTAGFTATAVRTVLHDALTRVARSAATSRLALPVAKCVRIEASADGLALSATNFDAFVRVTVAGETRGTGVVVVPVERLAAIVANAPTASTVTLAVDHRRATVTAGRATFQIAGMDPDEFPAKPVVAGERRTVEAGAFVDAITRVVAHASKAPSRPAMGTVLIERGRAVAADGQSIALLTTTDVGGPYLLHAASVPMLARLFAADASLAVVADSCRIQLESADVLAQIRLVDEVFPVYEPLLHQESPRAVVCNRDELSAAIQRVALTSDEDRRVTLTLGGPDITLATQTSDAGSAIDAVTAEPNGHTEPFVCAVNARTITKALDTFDGERVQLSFTTTDHPLFVRDADADHLTGASLAIVQTLRTFA